MGSSRTIGGTARVVRLGARVHVRDLSPVQVELNRRHVCYGGPLSYVRELADQALGESQRPVPASRRSGGRRRGELSDRVAHPDLFDALDDEEWNQLVSFELRLCREPGMLDAGTHILAAIRTPEPSVTVDID